MKKTLKKTLCVAFCTFTLLLGTALSSEAALCNSPCPDPCAPSHTVCEGSSCTTYCAKNPVYNTVYYSTPGVSFSYSTPNVSFSISNEVYGIYNYYSRPNFAITNGFRPVYHRVPPRPVHYVHKPAPKPSVAHKKPVPGAKNPPKPGHKPSHKPNSKPAPKG